MRKGDLELLEMRLEPHSRSIERLTADVGQWMRTQADMLDRVKDLERNEQTHSTGIAQGLASIRSLLQRANRAAREQGIVESDEVELPLDDPEPKVKVGRTADQVVASARAANPGMTVL